MSKRINPVSPEPFRGGSRISGKGVHIYKVVGVRSADCISFFLNIPCGLTETKLFHFHRILKTVSDWEFELTP